MAFSIRSGQPGRKRENQIGETWKSEGHFNLKYDIHQLTVYLPLPLRFLSTYCQCSPQGPQSENNQFIVDWTEMEPGVFLLISKIFYS